MQEMPTSIPAEVSMRFGQNRLRHPAGQFWQSLITEELNQLEIRNVSLAHLAALTIQDGPSFLYPFNTISYSQGFFGMHQLARTSGMYIDIQDIAFADYTNQQLVELQRGRPNFLRWMENRVNDLAPGALDAIDDSLHTVRFVVDEPEEVPGIHRPEMVWGAADVLLPIAYQLGVFTPPPAADISRAF